MRQKTSLLFKNFMVAVGILLVWRGLWYTLDGIDNVLFHGSHAGSAVIGVIVGLLILYWPDRDLKELGRL